MEEGTVQAQGEVVATGVVTEMGVVTEATGKTEPGAVSEPVVATEAEKVREKVEGRWRKSPRVLERLGLTEEDVASPVEALVKEGISRMFRVREAMRAPLEFTGEIPQAQQARAEEYGAWQQANAYRSAGMDLPLWQTISGLKPEDEAQMNPEQRERAIRLLLSAVIRLLKFEMQEAEKKKDDWRSYMWDPLPRLCFFLGISRAKLTRYAKEVMGLSAHEMVDGIRVLDLRTRMKDALRAFVGCALKDTACANETDRAFAVWKRLKASRKTPKWDRQSWAISLGFPNYSRMYRACLVLFGKTPGQLEFEVIEELVGEMGEVEKAVPGETRVGSERDKVQFFDGGNRAGVGDEVRRVVMGEAG